jgi:hypothetical protein
LCDWFCIYRIPQKFLYVLGAPAVVGPEDVVPKLVLAGAVDKHMACCLDDEVVHIVLVVRVLDLFDVV